MKNLYRNIVFNLEDTKLLNSDTSEIGEIFINSILDYLSAEIYKIDASSDLVNNIDFVADYMSSLITKGQEDKYFFDLLLQTIDAFNYNNYRHMIVLATTKSNEKIFDSNQYLIMVHLSKNISAKENFVWLCKMIEQLYRTEKIYRK